MAISVPFNGKQIKLPGVYAAVQSGIKRDIPLSTYSNVLLIDAGVGAGFNSIKGIGTTGGRECIYTLDQPTANFYIKGGPIAPVIEKLFTPAIGAPGIGDLHLIKAATTTAATISNVSLFGGAITIKSITTVEQGEAVNTYPSEGIEENTYEVKKGYLLRSIYDKAINKAYIELLQGSYEGESLSGFIIAQDEENSHPTSIYRSKKCSSPKELVDFLQRSLDLKALVVLDGIEAANPTATSFTEDEQVNKNFAFAGGGDNYMTSVADILPKTIDTDYSVMLILTKDAESQRNMVLVAKEHLENEAKGIKMLMSYEEDKNNAILQAQTYDSSNIIVASSLCKKTSNLSPTGFISQDNMVTAAVCLGRIFGLSPEIAGTFKTLDIDGMEEEPTEKDLEDMLDNGVITPYYDADFGTYVLSQVCNTLQENTELINPDCTTYSVQIMRCLGQVIKNLQQQAKLDFWSGNKGTNKGTLSTAYVKAWTKGLLDKLTVAPNKTENNYLLEYEVTKVELKEDSITVYIACRCNSEINKVFFLVTVLG